MPSEPYLVKRRSPEDPSVWLLPARYERRTTIHGGL